MLRSSLSDVLSLDLKRITGKGIISGSSFQVAALCDMSHRFGFSPLGGDADSSASREQQIGALERLIEGLQARDEASARADAAQQVCVSGFASVDAHVGRSDFDCRHSKQGMVTLVLQGGALGRQPILSCLFTC